MPAPAKTSAADVVAAARALLEAGGPAAVQMQAVAAAVGIKGPSLYKRFRDRADLLAEIEIVVLGEVAAALAAVEGAAPRARLTGQAYTLRAYAAAHPQSHALVWGPGAAGSERHLEARRAALAPSLGPIAALVGPERALTAARAVTAFVQGFVSLERAGLFRFGGDVDADFAAALGLVLDGIEGRFTLRSP